MSLKVVRHKKYPQLIGTLERRDNDNYGVVWSEPWLAASLLEGSDLFFLSPSEYEDVEVDERMLELLEENKKLRNITCTNCNGRGALKVLDRREILKFGPYKECFKCRGSGKIKAGVD